MLLPDYWLQRPDMMLDSPTRAAFDLLIHTARASAICARIDDTLAAPKWKFLCYAADQHAVVLHGTGDFNISIFEPRPSIDLSEFGAQTAVYGAGDGLWAMFFAIIDRTNYAMATSNACVRLVDQSGEASGPYYVFSISQSALVQHPWRKGMVYLLPRDTFINQPAMRFSEYQVLIPQLASLEPVAPFAQLEVGPDDFPFLEDIRGLDDSRLEEYGQAMSTGAPWPE